MYKISAQKRFSASHIIKDYPGECGRLHGHNWNVKVTVKAKELNDFGMAIDFKELSQILNEVIEKLDHYHLNDIPPFNEIQPTAENLAKFFYDELKSKLAQYKNVEIDSVEIWETEKYSAIYQE
ncbi:6-pyruvoyltetrahydropterin/6-carboxytetrahydropterin synthase [Candidatus Kryptonium thompsonii]|uniref:6-carboxy-5,6,7,8-tetrahydropterin synthase n=2 Tax=Candidatus Kryptonium thompsonii TaxID=1633631 RepID=A0A0P1P4T8_9BACT|nr:6-carboxytetrahydropterin synthase QueD [Candidatus Kryptonium thompsoni]CUS77767.1 6-pyruvoyltetrahydropterin/6-carboxytetrahydropterin synthase [Candidatus Kryptonium thompsoni]CUS78339.1 6-pyruvoyltetrahydropterin/6-carboxytetrahydropterin synthase [Candidatus Kryptonium thompsoni]CUS82174.1 6-pyruvoyltetrahydropterin/6-carboxytetrahydropterin synthase [Candidatus Kryptonium thompsoni]CUS83899.1 6-pyruvoyltetrahydropterin/6-carboxytetrahydropterin synthase [Candidatus Kryptonium thompsoni